MRLGLVGCGSIGGAVVRAIERGSLPEVKLIGIADHMESEVAATLAARLKCPFLVDVPSLLRLKPDLVLETASADAVRRYASDIFDCGADLMMISVGALADTEFLDALIEKAKAKNRRLHIPSGAIGGLDLIKAAAVDGLEECRLTTTKPPRALAGAPYVRQQSLNLETIKDATTIFEGTAQQAVRSFPQNTNIAATISLAGLGLERTRVKIVADPAATRNVHEVFLRGKFGEATIRLANQPSLENPKSSGLASLSVIATLRCVSQQFQLGT
jgi:aspartate dehydrogenase